MIKQSEILSAADTTGLSRATIDKDWVLGHLLNAIFRIPGFQDILVFKGGTCLRKCYFTNYRFSEDLDFTLLDHNFVFDEKAVKKIIEKASEISFHEEFNRGILYKLKNIEPTHSNDIEQGYKIFLHYWGADHKKNHVPSQAIEQWHHTIKLDINHTEEIIFPVNYRPINHSYTDAFKFKDTQVPCYAIEEVISEKFRSLIQRKYTSPRDCYDIWCLKNSQSNLDWNKIKVAFIKKARDKNIEFTGVEQLLNLQKEKILKQHWKTQLENQFPKNKVPDYSIIINELKHFLTDSFEN